MRVTNACSRQYQKTMNHFLVELPIQRSQQCVSGLQVGPSGAARRSISEYVTQAAQRASKTISTHET